MLTDIWGEEGDLARSGAVVVGLWLIHLIILSFHNVMIFTNKKAQNQGN